MKLIGTALHDWNMISEGDRLVVGLSGGKDSFTLLFALLDLKRRAQVNFEVCAATVDPMTDSYDPSPLINYMNAIGVTYHYIKVCVVWCYDVSCLFCYVVWCGLLLSMIRGSMRVCTYRTRLLTVQLRSFRATPSAHSARA